MKIILAVASNTQVWPKLLRDMKADFWLMSFWQLREGVDLEQQMTGKEKKNES